MLGLTIAMPSKALSSRRAPQSSVACRIVCTARQQHQPSSDNSGALAAAATILRTLETATLVLAAGAHWGAAASAHKVVAEAALGPTSDRGKRSRLDHASFAASTPALLAPVLDAPVPDWLPTGGLWLTLPLLIAFVVGRLAALLDLRRTATLRIAEGAAARLLHTDALLRQQGEALALLSRQVDKATMRSRLSSRDLRPPIKQLEATSAEQAALLSALVQRVDAAEHGVRDVEALVAALQVLAAKQFDVLAKVVARQAAASSSTSSALQPAPPPLQEEQHALQEKQQAATVPQPKLHEARRASVAPAASSELVSAAASQPHQQEATSGSPSVDEWGRRILVAHLPTGAAASSMTARPAPSAAAPSPDASAPAVALSAADVATEASSINDAAEHVQSAHVQHNADGSQTYRF